MNDHPELSLKNPASRLEVDAGGGLIVRPLAVDDAPAVAEAVAESLAELKRFMPWAHDPQTVASQCERLKGVNAAYWKGDDFGFGAFHRATGAFAGGFGLHRRTLNPLGLELGYWVRTRDAGQGLATIVSQALIAYAFQWLGCERVQCGHNAANAASGEVIRKCGFAFEGTLRCFEPTPTPAMVADGCIAAPGMHLYGLVRADLSGLSWLPGSAQSLRVYDWLGRPVALSQVTNDRFGT